MRARHCVSSAALVVVLVCTLGWTAMAAEAAGAAECIEPIARVTALEPTAFSEVFLAHSLPLVLSGYEQRVVSVPLRGLDDLAAHCAPDAVFTVRFFNKYFPSWGGLDAYNRLSLSELRAELAAAGVGGLRVNGYAKGARLAVIDEALAPRCPQLLRHMLVPALAANSLLPRLGIESLRDFWPRISFADAGFDAPLVVQPAALGLWLYVASGTIRVRVVARTDECALFAYREAGRFADQLQESPFICPGTNEMRSGCRVFEATVDAGALIYVPRNAGYQLRFVDSAIVISVAVLEPAALDAVQATLAQPAAEAHFEFTDELHNALRDALAVRPVAAEGAGAAPSDAGTGGDLFWAEFRRLGR